MTKPIKNERVLVTGGAGFIGSSIVKYLLKNKNDVVVLDNFVTGSLNNLQNIMTQIDTNQTNLADRIELINDNILQVNIENLLEKKDIDYVFNLAAEPFIPGCYDRPDDFFSVNANGTLRLLLACKKIGIERIVHYSSSEVYGTAQEVPMDEDHRTFPQSTYAVSKLASDRLCFTLYHEQNLPVVILRQFNTYGPRETHPYIIPELITQLSDSNEIKLGNIDASRDLTYVDDAARGASKLINCPDAEGEVVNLGYGEDHSVEQLANLIGELMGYSEVNIQTENKRFRPLDVQQLVCDFSKASQLINYEPTVSLSSGLKRTIEWYQENGPWTWETSLDDKLWEG
jgi:dTDP-glucose 4,6-dehydratase